MAVTTDVVKRLILEYIGGKKTWGNPVNVFSDQQKVVIQRKVGLLASLSSFLGNPLTNIDQMLTQLASNPMSSAISNVSSKLNSFTAAAFATGLPSGAYTQLSTMATNVTDSLTDMQFHTDTLSGQIYDLEVADMNKPTFTDLMMMPDPTQAKSLAGALFADNQLNSIAQSLDPAVPGGVSSLISNLVGATDDQKTAIVDNMCKQLQDHVNTMQDIITADESAYSTYRLNQSMEDLLIGMTPSVNNEVFQRVATNSFKQFTGYTSNNGA